MKRMMLIVTVLLAAGIILWQRFDESTQLREISAMLQGQILTASNRLASALSSVDSRRQQLASDSAKSDSVTAELYEAGRLRSQASASTEWASVTPPTNLPAWTPESPYIWLEKPLLKRMQITVFLPDGDLTPTATEFFAMETDEAKSLGQTLKRIVDEHRRQETARARVVQEHLPQIAKEEGHKFTLRIEPLAEISTNLKREFEAALAQQLGTQRVELLKRSIQPGLSDLFGRQASQVRTMSFVLLPSGLFQMAQQRGELGTFVSCCFPDIRPTVPEHLHHLIPPEFLKNPDEPTEP
jgi:hypothetical protein